MDAFIMETPIKMDDLEVPAFKETSIWERSTSIRFLEDFLWDATGASGLRIRVGSRST